MRGWYIVLLLGVVSAFAAPVPTRAWEPAGTTATNASTAAVLAAYERARGRTGTASYRETFLTTAPRESFVSNVLVRGTAYRVDTVLAGHTYASGRSNGSRWRQTPDGVVRFIESDVQGDDLDRWPLTVLGFAASDCRAQAQTPADWVLQCDSIGELPHWYYVNKSSGLIDREISRDGSRVVYYDFSDYRDSLGVMLPFRWSVSGAGTPVNVRMTARHIGRFPASALGIPQSTTSVFPLPGDTPLRIPASFSRSGKIIVPVLVNNRRYSFLLDTGTTQILMDVGAAARAGLQIDMGHAVAPAIGAGAITASNVPLQAVDLFHDHWDGILGNEFFIGHIVHVDYGRRRLEVLPRATFSPPPGAYELTADCSEGMPLVTVSMGNRTADRFALDTGSMETVVDQPFLRQSGEHWHYDGADDVFDFLEGPLRVRPAIVDWLQIGRFRFNQTQVVVAQESPDNVDLPLDGILANQMLEYFEWWYDYDGNRVWIRPV